MKTAMQELIENLDGEMKSRGMLPNWDMYLEKEKEQIINAYINGFPDDWESDKRIRYAKEYYNQEYGQAGRTFTQDLIPKN